MKTPSESLTTVIASADSARGNLIDSLPIWLSAQTTKSAGRGRSANNTHQYGVQKLRELILELAVRGKLVEQNPNDEPASVLLEKIADEKAKLVKEGKIKKPKNLPNVAADEVSYSLPFSWVWTRLGQITQINPRNETADDTTAAFIPMPLVSTTHTGKHGQEIKTWKNIKKGYTHFADGDVAVAKITPCFENGKAAHFQNLENGVGAGTTELHVARPYGETIDPRYLLIYLKAPQFLLTGETKMTGTAGQKRLPKEFFAENPLPLPPLAEQHRIVKKVDELMALCDKLEQQQADSIQAHDTLVKVLLDTLTHSENADDFQQNWRRIAEHFDALFTTESSIDQLKQTLLQLAVMGKLVPQDPNDEPASVLLEKIAAEKALLVKEGKIKKQKPLPEITEDEKPFESPQSWEWIKFGLLAEFINGDRGKNYPNRSEYVDDGLPWINTGHINSNGSLSYEKMNFITQEKYDSLRGGKVNKGDLVYCLRGATFGKTAFVEPFNCGAIASSLMIIRPYREELGHYIYRYLTSPFGKSQIFRFDNGSAQPNLSANSVMLYAFAMPPLAEQHRIVAKVDELMALCDQLKERLNQAQTLQQQLADAVVEQTVN